MNPSASVFVVFVILASAMGRPNREEWQAMKEKCIAESGVNPDLVKGPPSPDQAVTDEMKCFGACLMKEHKLLKDDGSVDLDLALSKIPADIPEREKMVEAVTECSAKKGANDCETAHEVFQCMKDKKIPFGPHGHGHHHHHDESHD